MEGREIFLEMKGKIRFQEFFKRNYVFFIAALVIFAWHTQIGLDGDSIWFSEPLEETSYVVRQAGYSCFMGWQS